MKKSSGRRSAFTPTNQHWQIFATYFILTAVLSLLPDELMAQAVVSGLKALSKTIESIVNVVFTIGITIGLIAVIIGFIADNPHKIQRLIYLIIAVLLWFGFTFVIEQIQTDVGGSGGFTK